MPRWMLATGMSEVRENPEFETRQEAWEYLRKILPNKYATLYQELEVEVFLNNKKQMVKEHNDKYKLQKLPLRKPYKQTTWIPVMYGNTNHPYSE